MVDELSVLHVVFKIGESGEMERGDFGNKIFQSVAKILVDLDLISQKRIH